MALSVNKVTLLGNVGKDPEYKVTPNGAPVCKFSIATSESFKDSNDQWQERTEWHNIECWRHTAETANKHLKKGSKVYIEGKLKTEKYDHDGGTKYITKIVAVEIVLIEKFDTNNEQKQAPQQQTAPRQVNTRPVQTQAYTPEMESEAWEDVPF